MSKHLFTPGEAVQARPNMITETAGSITRTSMPVPRPPSRLTRDTTPGSGRRMAHISLGPGESVRLYDDGDTIRVHCGPLMLPGINRRDVRLDVSHGIATVTAGPALIADATGQACDGAWPLALAWVLHGARDPHDEA